MSELEITAHDFAPLVAAECVPERLGFDGCDLVATPPRRDLDWQQGFEQLATLPRIRTISFTNANFTTFDARVLKVKGLKRIDVNKTPVDAAGWRDYRAAHPNVTIWGA